MINQWAIVRLLSATLVFQSLVSAASTFTAGREVIDGVDLVRLADATHQVEVTIVPSIGNRAVELKVHGKNLLYFPTSLAEFKASQGKGFNGTPFLAPWGNRLAGGGFWAGDHFFHFNPDLGNLNIDAKGIAIHGMLTASPLWEVVSLSADTKSAHVTSRLRFWRHPDLMGNWPFAHEYLMTYTLSASGLKVSVSIRNLSAQAMPVGIGFHPYFQIPDVPRSECTVRIPARKHVDTEPNLVATGTLSNNELPESFPLGDRTFDDGFTDLLRGADHLAVFAYEHGAKKIEVRFGPKYLVGLVFAPPKTDFICFEPMAAITDGINLAHDRKYSDLQMLAPGAIWDESFLIAFSGF